MIRVIEVTDALGRRVTLATPARSVVSLVPSETESVVKLAGFAPLAGRTSFCTEPIGVELVPTVGGTKDVDVREVIALEPDLVLANKEENARKPIEALIAAGVRVHVSFPCTLRESAAYLASLARMLGLERHPAVIAAEQLASAAERAPEPTLPVFVPIWRDPLMTFDGRTFASDLLRAAGARNVFADRPRAYPLAADLGEAEPLPAERVGDRDTRYPRVRDEEVLARAPAVVLLPDEPYAFGEVDAAHFRQLFAGRDTVVEFQNGKDLFWYGTRVVPAVRQLRHTLDTLCRGWHTR